MSAHAEGAGTAAYLTDPKRCKLISHVSVRLAGISDATSSLTRLGNVARNLRMLLCITGVRHWRQLQRRLRRQERGGVRRRHRMEAAAGMPSGADAHS